MSGVYQKKVQSHLDLLFKEVYMYKYIMEVIEFLSDLVLFKKQLGLASNFPFKLHNLAA